MNLLDFVREVRRLKEVKRKGWTLRGVRNPESVADHSFMLAILAYVYSRKLGLDSEKATKMALIHDICEVYTGDIATRMREDEQEVGNEEKVKREREGMEKLISLLPGEISEEIRLLWEEFLSCKTREAKLVKDLDRVEMCIQALDYAEREGGDFEEFFEFAKKEIETAEIKKLFEVVYTEFRNLPKKT